jgi:hypothetical protein
MELYASLGILSYVADRTARMGVRLITTTDRAETYPMLEETIREAYRAAEQLELNRPVTREEIDAHIAKMEQGLPLPAKARRPLPARPAI